jgi:hypothetical protein
MKECCKCHTVFPVEFFYAAKNAKDGLLGTVKSAMAMQTKRAVRA